MNVASPKPRLPITASVLQQMAAVLACRPPSHNNAMVWAACSLCFFGFFRSGEIIIPSQTTFDRSQHLAWGDVSMDDLENPTLLECI